MENYKKCKVENCEGNALNKNGVQIGKNFCARHRGQLQKYGKILERTKFDSNEIIDCGNYYEICLYNRQQEKIARTKIDKDDLEKIKQELNAKKEIVISDSKKENEVETEDA